MRHLIFALALLLLPAASALAVFQTVTETDRFVAPVQGANHNFGYGIGLGDGQAFVASPRYDDLSLPLAVGAVFTFEQSATWQNRQTLIGTNITANDNLGGYLSGSTPLNSNPMDMDGDWAAVGAARHDNPYPDGGKVYLYQNTATGWTLRQELLPTGATGMASNYEDFRFGHSVSLDGNRLVVGAPEYVSNASTPGQVYVYTYDGAQWNLEQEISPANGVPGDRFGNSVSLDGDVLLVGARFRHTSIVDAGTAYVYTFDGASWTQAAFLENPNDDGQTSSGDHFGAVVQHTQGQWAFVSVPNEDYGGFNLGAVIVYKRQGNTWIQHQALNLANQGPDSSDRFGVSMRAWNDWLAVGATGRDFGANSAGAVYTYQYDPGADRWEERHELRISNPNASDGLSTGLDIAPSGGNLVVMAGSTQRDAGGISNSGETFVFDLGPVSVPPTATPAAPTNTPLPTATPTLTPTSTPEPTPTASLTPTPSPSPTATATPVPTATPTPTSTPTATPTPTATLTATPGPSPTPTGTATFTPSPTPSPTATQTPQNKPTATPTPQRPQVAIAGWMGTDTIDGAGTLEFFAYVESPVAPLTSEAEFYVGGVPTGVRFGGDPGGGVYTFTAPVAVDEALPPPTLIEFAAEDVLGFRSELWPYLHVGQ